MWTANGWFGFSREQLNEFDEKSAHTQAKGLSSRPENKGLVFHVNQHKNGYSPSSVFDEKSTVASYRDGNRINKEEMDESVAIDHSRYMRSHGKKARDSGQPGKWMFTSKEYGDVNHDNSKEFHSAHGKFADAKKSAQNWAKEHGHHRVYVMEDVEQMDEVSKRTLGSYATKALNRADIAARMSHSDSDEMGKIAAKRTAGVKKAVDKLATKKADATRIKTNVDRAREAARNRYTDKDDQGKAYYAAQKGISKIRESVDLDESLTNMDKVLVHTQKMGTDTGRYGVFNVVRVTPTQIHAHDHYTKQTIKFNAKNRRGIGDDNHLWIKRVMTNESVELDELMLTSLVEGTVYHGPYVLSSSKARHGKREGEPTHINALQTKMNQLGVPQHDEDDYGDTILINVRDTRTGEKTNHHVYQRGFTEIGNQKGDKVVSVRTVGRTHPKSEKHNDVIKNYLSGNHFKNLKEQWINDTILTALVEEALAAKRPLKEARVEKDLQDHEPRVVHGYKGMKQRPFSKKFKSQEHMEKWLDSDSSADHEIHTIEKA